MHRVLALFAPLLALGCTEGEVLLSIHELRISPAFAPADVHAIMSAAAEWCAVAPRACLPVETDSARPNVHPGPCPAGKVGYIRSWAGETRIDICDPPDIWRTAAHEIGHGLRGRSGHTESGIMLSGGPPARCIDTLSAQFVLGGDVAGTCD